MKSDKFAPRGFTILSAFALVVLATAAEAGISSFEVVFTPEVSKGPVSCRVYVMLDAAGAAGDPRFGPNWFMPSPFFATDAETWEPGAPLTIDGKSLGFPVKLPDLKPGKYKAQAVVRLSRDVHEIAGPGNAYSPVAVFDFDPNSQEKIRLVADKIAEQPRFRETERIKLLDIPSPMLSAFHKREIRHRAAVSLPEGDLGRKRATLYVIPGFGGDHRSSIRMLSGPLRGIAREFLVVLLSPDCGTGHHVFADSEFNGPRGKALLEELIPHVEQTYPAIAEPGARLLNGHSSGGWSSLWLQVTYPEYFGGTWSTSPDPVDFRDFSRINLYKDGENAFRDAAGKLRPIARRGGQEVLLVENFSRMEDVIGDGGQFHSFEAVFSPLGPDARPRPIWDRQSGAIDLAVAKAWEKYDIRLVLERGWKSLGPKLSHKLNIITGELDTFYLEGAVKLIKESLHALGSDAVVEIVPGKDHGAVLTPDLWSRIEREMLAATAKYRPAAAK